tara:strand:- start:811 stop:1644 length:834 start_codon:yes stop_codon:yes gene_type:complete
MKHILVPIDFSNNSINAITYAMELFKNTTCSFYILHVGKLNQSDIANNAFLTFPTSTEQSVEQKFKANFSKIKKLNFNTKHHFFPLLEYGNIIDKIRETVHNKKIDLIVMGTKGASGIKEKIIGSNTGDVITKVPVNLLVIPEKATYKTLKNISFPTDYNTFYSYKILNTLTELLHLDEGNLRVINASTKKKLNIVQLKNKAYLQDYLEEVFEDTHSFHSINNMKVKNAIEDFTNDGKTDMILMAAKSINFLQQILFDTTIQKLSFHTTVPLFVLHE